MLLLRIVPSSCTFVILWKKPDLLSKDTHPRVPSLAGADAKDQLTGEAMTWDLLTFVRHWSGFYFIPSPPVCLKYINIAKCQIRVWEKLETNQLCFQPTSKSEVVFFSSFSTQNLLDMGSNCFSEVKFLGCFKIASMLFSPLCFFPLSLGQFQGYPVIISISAGDNEWRGTYVTCSMVTLQPSLLCRGASGMLSIRGLRFLERKIWGFFLRAKLHSPNKWSNMQEEKCLINVFILLNISF